MKIKILIFLILSIFTKSVFAENIENVFSDIDKNYIYYNELQSLYDKWMIFPDSNNKFNPNSLIKRDDFVWITMEVNCIKCIQPATPVELITKYSNILPFFDVFQENKNFYCISEWKNNWFTLWYDKSYKCDDWTTKNWESPFCINNNITKEEALAIMLRKSSIFTLEDSEKTINDIRNWIITENLANDLTPKIDWSPYTFYWYFQKALDYSLVEYDSKWNKKEYKLLEKDSNWNLNPRKAITKQEFLKWAYILLKANSCNISSNQTKLNIWVDLNILDKICTKSDQNCKKSSFPNTNETIYDIKAIVWWVDLSKLTEKSYVRQLYNQNTWESGMIYWSYVDNYKFNNWNRKINLIVVDSDWNIWKAQWNLYVNNNSTNSSFSIDMHANPVYWNAYLWVDFTSTNSDSSDNYTYNWDFWDWQTWNWKNIDHIYQNPWVYEAKLIVTNIKTLEKKESKVTIKVDAAIKCSASCSCEKWSTCSTKDPNICSISWICLKDTDNDWLTDNIDKCPLIYWPITNKWCPILSKVCSSDNQCNKGSVCNIKDLDSSSKQGICVPENNIPENSCLYPDSWSSIFWNMMCNSCPCNLNFDFLASIRKCDTIFPAIISPDKTTIYWKWNNYLIK